jgi:hypothetical protein
MQARLLRARIRFIKLFRWLMPEKLVAAHQAGRLQFLGTRASGRRPRCSRRGTRPHRAMAIPLRTRVCSWQTIFMLRTTIIGAVCAALLSPSASSSLSEKLSRQDGNVATGQLVFNNACRTCHTTKEGDNRLGPHLYKIVGRKAGSLPLASICGRPREPSSQTDFRE